MNVYDISISRSALALTAGERTELEITVTNTSGAPSTALVSVTSRHHPGVEWLSFEHLAQHRFDTDETAVIPLSVATTATALPGDSLITVLVASEHNPDEDFATYDLALTIDAAEARPRRRWLPWALLVLGCLLLGTVVGLVIGISSASQVAEVPDVTGLPYAVAAEQISAAGFEVRLAATSTGDLDTPQFRSQSAAIIAAIRQRQAELAESEAAETGSDTAEPSTATHSEPMTSDARDLRERAVAELEAREVWFQDQLGESRKGSTVTLKVVPDLTTGPELAQLAPLAAMEEMADSGLRFHADFALPEDYRYGTDRPYRWVWALNPPVDLIHAGTKVTLRMLPERLAVPDFTRTRLAQLHTRGEFNLRYVYQYTRGKPRLAAEWKEVQQWIDIQRRHDREPYVYRQTPPAGALVPTTDHVITVFVDTRDGAVATR